MHTRRSSKHANSRTPAVAAAAHPSACALRGERVKVPTDCAAVAAVCGAVPAATHVAIIALCREGGGGGLGSLG